MTIHVRIFGIAICLLLASGTDGWAASKRKAGRGKSPAKTYSAPAKAAPATTEVAPSKGSVPGPAETRPSEARAPLRESVRQESRIEFDERMLRGQSAAGVIYLFQRTPSEWKSIVEVPDSFRARTVNILTPAEERK
jgi:hypothetical protein